MTVPTSRLARHCGLWMLTLLCAASPGPYAEAGQGTAESPVLAPVKQTRPAPQGRADARDRFYIADDAIHDASTGLAWASQDNGSDIDWSGALQYCTALGTGWDLPTVAELLTLADGSDGHGKACADASCTLAVPFTSFWFWTRETSGSDQAWIVTNGQRLALAQANTRGTRAYCVRRP